jgi:hypothetical protein
MKNNFQHYAVGCLFDAVRRSASANEVKKLRFKKKKKPDLVTPVPVRYYWYEVVC